MPTRETGVAEMDDQLTAALAERGWTEPDRGSNGTNWASPCGSYWARGEAGFSSVRWYLREDMSIEARTTTLSEALTQLDLLTPAAPEQLPRDGSTKDRYTAPAPGEMQYRANKLLGEHESGAVGQLRADSSANPTPEGYARAATQPRSLRRPTR